jgi:hypothetical protein
VSYSKTSQQAVTACPLQFQTNMIANLDTYFRSQQVSLQWSPILFAMANELEAIASPVDLRQLFQKIGARFSEGVAEQFLDIKALPELNDALNDLWARTQWGYVQLQEAPDCIEISHQFSPLYEAFGERAIPWTIGLLEGFYQSIFRKFGAAELLTAQCVGIDDNGQKLNIRFA